MAGFPGLPLFETSAEDWETSAGKIRSTTIYCYLEYKTERLFFKDPSDWVSAASILDISLNGWDIDTDDTDIEIDVEGKY